MQAAADADTGHAALLDGIHELDHATYRETMREVITRARGDGAKCFRFPNAWFEKGNGRMVAFVENETVVAYSYWRDILTDEGTLPALRQLYTVSAHRRRGHASRLVDAIAGPLDEFGVLSPTSGSMRVFEKLGYGRVSEDGRWDATDGKKLLIFRY